MISECGVDVRHYTNAGKLLSRGIAATLVKTYPSKFSSVKEGEEFWDSLMRYLADALLSGHPVVLRGIGSLQPYIKGASACYHPRFEKRVKFPQRRHIRFALFPTMRDRIQAVPITES